MDRYSNLKELGFSQYEAACYMALAGSHPVNGSQLSKISGIARSRIYDVLRSLKSKGYVLEVSPGQHVPLPPDELIKRLTSNFSSSIKAFEEQIAKASQKSDFEYIWTITGYENVMEKAIEMIKHAKKEIYTRVFPEAGKHLDKHLTAAVKKGVKVRYIAMGKIKTRFDIQVIHPGDENLEKTIGGRSIDIITDRKEALVGIFETGSEDNSPINWTRNHWFITANRDSLRHDFYHTFLEKTVDQHSELTKREKRIYQTIKDDN